MNNPLRWIAERLSSGSRRSALLKQNVLFSLCIKAGSILCSLVLVPMTIDFVNPVQYAIWLTVSSIVGWMSFFDIGFSNGLRNKLAEALAHGDIPLARSLVSTTYAMLTRIFLAVMVVLLVVVWTADVCSLLKINPGYEPDLKVALTILVSYFCINFVVRTLGYVLMADQRNAFSSLIEMIGQVGVLIVISLLRSHVEGTLTVLALCLCLPPLAVWVVASLICYAKRYRQIRPSRSEVHREHVRLLLSLGVKFFVIQIAALIQFATANFLIAQLFEMQNVTDYNIAYKYFNVLYMCFFLMLQPFWSAVTDAYTKQDIAWIRAAVRKYIFIASGCLLTGLVMLVLSPWIYDAWVGDNVHIDFSLSAWVFVYFMSMIFGSVFCMFVNGIGALKIQYVCSLISPVLYIAATLVLSKTFGVGLQTIPIAAVIANFYGLVIAPIQYRMIIIRKKQGIWSK